MKKIVILTGNSPFQRYCVNTINERFPVDAVFINGGVGFKYKIKELKKRYKTNIFFALYKHHKHKSNQNLIRNDFYPEIDKQKEKIFNKLFENKWEEFDFKEKVFFDKKKKFGKWYKKIKEINPDIIIVHGGGWVPERIIELANDYTMNLHWGYSPFYRGTYCTAFCIYNNEIDKIGVTIHELSQKIDGGDIYEVGQPFLEKDDSIFSIEMKLTKKGTELILKLLNEFVKTGKLQMKKQDHSTGNLYLEKHMTVEIASEINKKVKIGLEI